MTSLAPDLRADTAPTAALRLDRDVVVVGAGFAGLAVAKALGGSDLSVLVIDRRNYHLFQPLLYQVATAALSPADIAEPIRKILSRHKNVDVAMAEVVGVDPAARRVDLAGEGRSPTAGSSSPPVRSTTTSATTTGRRWRRG